MGSGAGTTSYYLQDGLGSTMQLVNTSGTVTDSYTYDAFGAMTSHTGTNPQPSGYASQQQDVGAEGGLGLGADASIDVIKNKVLCNNEKVGDEGVKGSWLGTRLGNWVDGHFGVNTQVNLPGIHQDHRIDWAWGTP